MSHALCGCVRGVLHPDLAVLGAAAKGLLTVLCVSMALRFEEMQPLEVCRF